MRALSKRMYIGIGLIVTLSFLLAGCSGRSQLKENYKDNGKNEPYAQQTPLSEMDFSIYTSQYCSGLSTLLEYNYTRMVELPCDVDYYQSPEDASPVFTMPKGRSVYILPQAQHSQEFPTTGYGLQCWPDYRKGWRYGQPFVIDDFSVVLISEKFDKYYVKTEQIVSVAEEFYRQNPNFNNWTVDEFLNEVVFDIDQKLYDNGAFCSPDLAG